MRNLSQVSQSSSTSSPMSKMTNVKKSCFLDADDLDNYTANEKDECHFNSLHNAAFLALTVNVETSETLLHENWILLLYC